MHPPVAKVGLKVGDITIAERHIELLGKGRKQRRVPLWPQTQKRLRRWLKDNRQPPEAPLLPNRFAQHLTRAGAAYQLKQLVERASAQMPSLKKRRLSPHSFRHYADLRTMPSLAPKHAENGGKARFLNSLTRHSLGPAMRRQA
jgi:integrase